MRGTRSSHPLKINRLFFLWMIGLLLITTGCLPEDLVAVPAQANAPSPTSPPAVKGIVSTPLPTRPAYQPGELVDYVAQPGDSLPALAVHFNTTLREIRNANTFIPDDATTMPPGMPMKIPIYYQALWGSPYHIIPDSLFVNGPAQTGFDTAAFVNQHAGWFKNYSDYVADRNRSGAEIVDYVATNYSVSPRLLLALLEYQLGALSQPYPTTDLTSYPLSEINTSSTGVYRQLAWAANILSNGYYEWREGMLDQVDLPGGTLERFDPWQNAASVAFHYYFSRHLSLADYQRAISPEGFAKTYRDLYGDPWQTQPHIPGSLRQPAFLLPFELGKTWAFTGGPHGAWGTNAPLAAIDFAPPSIMGGCTQSDEWVTAVADGVIVRTDTGVVVLDLDGDMNEHTGWDVFYLHMESIDKIQVGAHVKAGQRIGHPSCEGGEATGTHVHMARKYNGEWISAGGAVPYNLEGWIASNGSIPYLGYLKRNGRTVTACVCSDQSSQLQAEIK